MSFFGQEPHLQPCRHEPLSCPAAWGTLGSTVLLPSCLWELEGKTSPPPGWKCSFQHLGIKPIFFFNFYLKLLHKSPSNSEIVSEWLIWHCFGNYFLEKIKLKINNSPLNKTAMYSLSGYATSFFVCLVIQILFAWLFLLFRHWSWCCWSLRVLQSCIINIRSLWDFCMEDSMEMKKLTFCAEQE